MSIVSRKNLADPKRPRLWRSLDELAQTPEFLAAMAKEFPDRAGELEDGQSRRNFLKYMGASLALAGLSTACTRRPTQQIVPYVRQPEEMIPGKPLYFATAMTFGGYARGIVVESHEGRPTKIEGNPDHPASLGAADAIGQAHVLDLYDPDRSQTVTHTGEVSSWSEFTEAISKELAAKASTGGQGIRILTETITSPTLGGQIAALLKQFPNLKWHQYDPIGSDNARAGAKLAFGADARVAPVYHFDRAKVIVSLDDNFLADHSGSLAYARQFADGRRVTHEKHAMNRLYVAQSTPTITGAMADVRLNLLPSEVDEVTRFVAAALGIGSMWELEEGFAAWVSAVAADLKANPGASLVVAGECQPPAVHALAYAINAKLGNVGKTILFIESPEVDPVNHTESLKQLCADMDSDLVDVLIMIGGDPVYNAPADLEFQSRLNKVRLRIHHGLYEDETSFYCHWHVPMTHELEAWGDARAFDGSASIIQPLIAPLYQGRSTNELLAILLGQRDRTGYDILRDHWRGKLAGDFEKTWVRCLSDGTVRDSASASKEIAVTLNAENLPEYTVKPAQEGIEIMFRPDPQVWDGRYANNGWLQEIPRPLTRLTWDNVILMSAATAREIGVQEQQDYRSRAGTQIVEVTHQGRTVKGPVWVLPGHHDKFITVFLGYGRSRPTLKVSYGAGYNAYSIRTSAKPWFAGSAEIRRTGESMDLACVQNHQMMEQHGRDLVHVIPLGGEHESGHHTPHKGVSLSLYPEFPYPATPEEGNKWGMVIDQNSCIGCNACVAACQSENNIAVVGKDQVMRGREMHWLRIDNYYGGEPIENAEGPYFQPIPCMHCENAPCELVCPVGATVHDNEGTNNMVYNRCIGTRYCSNNCPYKVRHFNFLQYSDETTESLKLMRNPNVTVRTRGVMEKCTYCVQRINSARITAKKEDRPIRDGEVVPACAQTCPTQAITFGNLNDVKAKVAKLAHDPENYSLLDEELQTKPRTTYLPRYTNGGKTP